MKKKLVYTDLDGTLLDLKSYSFMQSIGAIEKLKSAGVPVIFCSSKTRKEQEFYRESLDLNTPFIVENGSAIYIPKGYFSQPIPYNTYQTKDYEVICLGKSVSKIRQLLLKRRQEFNLAFDIYEDLPAEEVSMITGLDMTSARRAMQRDFSETILRGETSQQLYQSLEDEGLQSIPGSKFETVMSKEADKGKAVTILTELYKAEYGTVESYGIGDSQNDAEMLASVEKAFLVQRPNGEWADVENAFVKVVNGIGPKGWVKVVEQILK